MYITTMYEVLGGQKDSVAEGDGSEIEQQVLYLYSISHFYLIKLIMVFLEWKIHLQLGKL